jgi:large subunit ribosomal protein L6
LKSDHKFVLLKSDKYIYLKNISLSLLEIKKFLRKLNNFNKGLNQEYFYQLSIKGVGYRFLDIANHNLSMKVGFSDTVNIALPNIVSGFLLSSTDLVLCSYYYDLLKLTCSKIKKVRKPEIYKGKGIYYPNENIVLKEIKK